MGPRHRGCLCALMVRLHCGDSSRQQMVRSSDQHAKDAGSAQFYGYSSFIGAFAEANMFFAAESCFHLSRSIYSGTRRSLCRRLFHRGCHPVAVGSHAGSRVLRVSLLYFPGQTNGRHTVASRKSRSVRASERVNQEIRIGGVLSTHTCVQPDSGRLIGPCNTATDPPCCPDFEHASGCLGAACVAATPANAADPRSSYNRIRRRSGATRRSECASGRGWKLHSRADA